MKKKVVIYPGFGTSTHEPLHLKLINFLSAVPISYSQILSFRKLGRKESLLIKILAGLQFSYMNLFPNKRNKFKYRNINLLHSVIQFSIRMNPIGKLLPNSRAAFEYIRSAIEYVRCCERCFNEYDVILVLGGDESYIHGSVLGQMAVNNTIPNLFLKQSQKALAGFHYDAETMYAGPQFRHYPSFFSKLKPNDDVLNEAEKEIIAAVNGNANYFFMRNQNTPIPELTGAERNFLSGSVVLFLHDFIDSPGIYGNCVFLDQWEWIEQTIKVLKQCNKKLVIKIHPNINESNLPAIKLLKEQCEENKMIFFIEKKTSLVSLQQAGIAGVLTLFGSVIVECAYLQIPCISAANNPYIGFGISSNAISINDYRTRLKNLCQGELRVPVNLKLNAIHAYIANRMIYLNNYLLKDCPYDDVEKSLFQTIYSDILGVENYGINERRQIFLRSDKMQHYVEEYLIDKADEVKVRFYFLLENNAASKN